MQQALKLSLLSIACALSPALFQAEAATVYGVKIWEQGVYDCSVKSYRRGDTGGNAITVSTCKVLNITTTVTAGVGTLYGCKYELSGSPVGETVTLQHKKMIPHPGVQNATTQEWFLESDSFHQVNVGMKDGFIGWRVDNPSELVPGTWTFEIRHEGRVLGSCNFEIKT